MTVRVLVVGSDPTRQRQTEFANACYLLGQELGRKRCHVVLGSNRPSTADHHVLRGLRSIPGNHAVTIVRPFQDKQVPDDGGSIPHSEEVGDHSAGVPEDQIPPGNLKIVFIPVRGPWGVGRITQVLRADVIIAIGGRSGTENVVQIAPELRRPVVAIPSFGGKASEGWRGLMRDYTPVLGHTLDLQTLSGPWRDEHASLAVALAIRLARNNPYEDQSWKQFMYLALGIFVLIGGWALVFSYPCGWWLGNGSAGCSNDRPTMFVLFWLAAFIGTGLRAAKRVADDPAERTSARLIFFEGAIGLSVSFGLSLLYMAGLFLAANDSALFPLLSEKPSDFRRTAVLMSTISFASAFLLEGSFIKLRDSLRERVIDEK